MSVFFVACTPIILLEATTAQNDIVAAFFFLSIIYFLIKMTKENCRKYFFYLSLSIALGFLTKASVLIFALPFLLIFGCILIYKHRFKIILPGILCSLIITGITSPYFYRNFNSVNTLMGDKYITKMMKNESLNFQNGLVNSARNFGMNIGLPFT